jgi:hypothetical protein
MVVVAYTTSVTEPTGQLVTVGAQERMVEVEVARMVEVTMVSLLAAEATAATATREKTEAFILILVGVFESWGGRSLGLWN